jgi:hypothetical protein
MKDSVTIIKLLHDMRTVINNVNSNNNNIYSFEFKKCEIQCSWKNINDNNIHKEQQQSGQQQGNHHRVIIQDGWIDVCKELLCINLTVEEKSFRVTYKDIYGLNFCADLNRVEVSS